MSTKPKFPGWRNMTGVERRNAKMHAMFDRAKAEGHGAFKPPGAEKIEITIETGNAAFDETPTREIARILRGLAARFERDGIPPATLQDVNGNTCGAVTVTRV